MLIGYDGSFLLSHLQRFLKQKPESRIAAKLRLRPQLLVTSDKVQRGQGQGSSSKWPRVYSPKATTASWPLYL